MSTNHQFPKHTGITDIQIAVGSRCICRPTLRQSFSSCGHRLVDSWSSNHKFREQTRSWGCKRCWLAMHLHVFSHKAFAPEDTDSWTLCRAMRHAPFPVFKKLTGWALQLVENKKRRHACIFAATWVGQPMESHRFCCIEYIRLVVHEYKPKPKKYLHALWLVTIPGIQDQLLMFRRY